MWMNGIRQMIVASIFVYSIELIINRKLWKYLILIFLCSFIHKSALILLPVYFLPNKDFFTNRYYTIGLLFIALFLGANPTFISASQTLSNILSFLNYQWYSDNLDTVVADNSIMAFGIRHFSLFATNIFIIWFSPYLKKRFKTKTFLFYYNLSVICALSYELFFQSNYLFFRPFLYTLNFTMIISSYLLYYLYKRNKTKGNFIIYVSVIVTIVVFTIYNIYDAAGEPNETVLFKFFWNYT
jgi:transmembrane protein EpsG